MYRIPRLFRPKFVGVITDSTICKQVIGGGSATGFQVAQPPPKLSPQHQVIVDVNGYIRELYSQVKNKRVQDSQQGPPFKKRKSKLVEEAVFTGIGCKTKLEKDLEAQGCVPKVAFDDRIRPYVEKKYPSFYRYYESVDEVNKALRKFNMEWTWG